MSILNTAADNLLKEMIDYYVSGEYTKPFSSEELADCVINHAVAAGMAAIASSVVPGIGAGVVTVVTTVAVWRMYIKMAAMIGTPIKEKTLKVIASAAISNMAMNAAVMIVVSFLPVVGTVASGVINFASVYTAGLIFLTTLTRLFKVKREDINDISNEEWLENVKDAFENINVKKVIKEAASLFSDLHESGRLEQMGKDVDLTDDDPEEDLQPLLTE